MSIHDKAVKNMIEGYKLIGYQPTDGLSSARIVRTCEICGGSTESIDDHICEHCRESIRKLFRENRCLDIDNQPDELSEMESRVGLDTIFDEVKETLQKYQTAESLRESRQARLDR